MSRALRRRATAIVMRSGRTLLVRDRGRRSFALPGGGVNAGEAAAGAVARELYEETTLAAHRIKYLFRHSGKYNAHYVFRVDARCEVSVADDPMVEEFLWWDGGGDAPIHPHVNAILSKCAQPLADRNPKTSRGTANVRGADHSGIAADGIDGIAAAAPYPAGNAYAHSAANAVGADASIAPAAPQPASSADAHNPARKRIRRRATAIIARRGATLLLREPGDDEFHLPGGGIDKGELPICAAIRELREETGMTPRAVEYLFDHCEFYSSDDGYIGGGGWDGQIHSVFRVDAEGQPALSPEHCELAWWDDSATLPLADNVRRITHMARTAPKSEGERR